MHRYPALRLFLSLGLLALIGFRLPAAHAQETPFKALLFTKTTGFRHDSIPSAVQAIQALGQQHGFTLDHTEDASKFTEANLAQYQVVIFGLTTGDVLNATQQAAFEAYIRGGGGYAGIHSASDTEYTWSWYGRLVGAYFKSHPAIQPGTVLVEDPTHPSTATLPRRWSRTDEFYDFQSNPRGTVHVLASLDERTYSGGTMGHDHPIAWAHNFEGGRAWYTGMGHTAESYSEPKFLEHLLGGIQAAAGVIPADNSATVQTSFQKVILNDSTLNPMQLDVAPDGRVFFIERGGNVKVYKPDTQTTVLAGQITVSTSQEDGLLGIALDPNFAQNRWVYLFYAHPHVDPMNAENRLSRFTMEGDTLRKDTEKIVLRVPLQRAECCHSAGALAFGPDGTLYLSTGDNTNPFASDGFAPIDERAGRSPWDAQKSSSNTNDLRGKILRIQPEPDGTYTIPDGNLFPPGAPQTRPEIYVMGTRNPFRISVDPKTGWLYWGDVGPDSQTDDPNRGPRGYDEWNQARSAGFFGWPYFVGNNYAYRDYNFDTQTSGPAFQAGAPVNRSPNNTGLANLPPTKPAWIWYPYAPSTEFPELNEGGGRTAMAGPVYRYDPNLNSDRKLPAYFDNTLFIYEWSRNWIKAMKMDDQGSVLKINPLFRNMTFKRPMDMKIGPDGAIYLIEYGTDWGNNPDAQIVRIDYVSGSRAPLAKAAATPTSGRAPLTVQFTSSGTFDPDNDPMTYAWDFDGNETTDSTDPNPSFTYTQNGSYTARLTVTDSTGKTAIATVPINVGNTVPALSFHYPAFGTIYEYGQPIYFKVTATDAEDGALPCEAITTQVHLGHDTHAHPMQELTGCGDSFTISRDNVHGSTENLFLMLESRVTDQGAPGVNPITVRSQVVLQPKRKQAEHFSTNNGTVVETGIATADGQANLGYIAHGDHFSFKEINLQGIRSISFGVSSAGTGGRIEIHADSPTGPKLGQVSVANNGDWHNYRRVTATLQQPPGGARELFFVFLRYPGDDGLFNVDYVEFNPSPTLDGDLNRDAAVNVTDVVLALQMAVDLLPVTPGDLDAGDMNADGVIDVRDAVLLLRIVSQP